MESPYRNKEGLITTLENTIREQQNTIKNYEDQILILNQDREINYRTLNSLIAICLKQKSYILGLSLLVIAMIIFFISLLGAF
jgi:hypothetical protein